MGAAGRAPAADDPADDPAADPAADFEGVYQREVTRVVRLAALLGATDPEDVAQESFCRLYAAWSRIEAAPAAYLNRVVVNEVRSRARRAGTARAKAHLLRPAPEVHPPTGDRAAVTAELRRLPDRQREALVLRYWLDLPLAEVAAAMGVRVGTAKSTVSRGLAALGEALGEEA